MTRSKISDEDHQQLIINIAIVRESFAFFKALANCMGMDMYLFTGMGDEQIRARVKALIA